LPSPLARQGRIADTQVHFEYEEGGCRSKMMIIDVDQWQGVLN
jgi:hypothetical protein